MSDFNREKGLSLAKRIEKYIEEKKEFTLQELYREFGTKHARETIRARVYESNKVIRTGRGAYILAGAEIEAVIEQVDTRKEIYRLKESSIRYDMIFLDIPYSCQGQKGGNRNLSDYEMISPDEFKDIIVEVEKLLRTEDSTVYFMIAGGKSSIKCANKYINMFSHTGLKLVEQGTYTKLTSSGKVANMGKYPMPAELILAYSKSGKMRFEQESDLHFSLQRPPLPRSGGYKTEKPLKLIQSFVKRSTLKGEWVLDLFSGSGVAFEACLSLGRKIYGFELEKEAIDNHILPRIKRVMNVFSPVGELIDEKISMPAQKRKQLTLFDFM